MLNNLVTAALEINDYKYLVGRYSPLSITERHEKGMYFVDFKHLMMLDWDIEALPGHKSAKCCTIEKREDAINLMRPFVDEGYSFFVEYTPGGVRAWELSRKWDVVKSPGLVKTFMTNLNCDKQYIGMTLMRGRFASRISPKPDRGLDWVAKHHITLGNASIPQELHWYLDKTRKYKKFYYEALAQGLYQLS